MLLVLAAGWNSNSYSYATLDHEGTAWRKAEVIALAELCALNGHPFSVVHRKIIELQSRANGSHLYFLQRGVTEVHAIPPPSPAARQIASASPAPQHAGHLDDWIHGRSRTCAAKQVETLVCEARDSTLKRRREAEFLAEIMHLPVHASERILEVTGSLEASLDQSIRQELPASKWRRPLNSSIEVIDLSDGEETAPETASAQEQEVHRLVEMGFSAEQANAAMKRAQGNVARAVEMLL
eukprot:TRINITY_DN60423_c0_g1_i1.p1 TRINITY_DN60423_c0_g1~~TRINITY_DN60423_c0_g1_i1.p1  ORF type:complete len:250 (-),score=47.85 TRINITY_DN60423_c0_g1_i1:51-767(-)